MRAPKFAIGLAAVLALCGISTGAVTGQRAMHEVQVETDNPSFIRFTKYPQTNEKTWRLATRGSPGYAAVRDFANECFNWVVRQNGARGLQPGSPKSVVVAAFWNSATKRIEASTVPRGKRAFQMMLEGSAAAPWWLEAAKGYVQRENPPLCAEDGVVYNAESTRPNGIDENGYFEDNSFVAVWGTHTPGDMIGKELQACKFKRNKRNIPGCQSMLKSMNIEWSEDAAPYEWSSSDEDERPWPQAADSAAAGSGQGRSTRSNKVKRGTGEVDSTDKLDGEDGGGMAESDRAESDKNHKPKSEPQAEKIASGEASLAVSNENDIPHTWALYTGTINFPTSAADIKTVTLTGTERSELTTFETKPSKPSPEKSPAIETGKS